MVLHWMNLTNPMLNVYCFSVFICICINEIIFLVNLSTNLSMLKSRAGFAKVIHLVNYNESSTSGGSYICKILVALFFW